jgi:hypothetical protein
VGGRGYDVAHGCYLLNVLMRSMEAGRRDEVKENKLDCYGLLLTVVVTYDAGKASSESVQDQEQREGTR